MKANGAYAVGLAVRAAAISIALACVACRSRAPHASRYLAENTPCPAGAAKAVVEPGPRRLAGNVGIFTIPGPDGDAMRGAIGDALAEAGFTVHEVPQTWPSSEECQAAPDVCLQVLTWNTAQVHPRLDVMVVGRLGELARADELRVYDARTRALIRRLRFRRSPGDLVLPMVLPSAVVAAVADHFDPPSPPSSDEAAQLECFVTDGMAGYGCPDALRARERRLVELRGVPPLRPVVVWRGNGYAVRLAASDVEPGLRAIAAGPSDPAEIRAARFVLDELHSGRQSGRDIPLRYRRLACRGERCVRREVETTARIRAIVVRLLRLGYAEVRACGGAPLPAVHVGRGFHRGQGYEQVYTRSGDLIVDAPDGVTYD